MLMITAHAARRIRDRAAHGAPAVASGAGAIVSPAAHAAQATTGSSFPHLFERRRGAVMRMA